MKKQNSLSLNILLSVVKQQQEHFGKKANLDIYNNYLDFRETQWKKCNTTLQKMRQDNKAQQKMLSNGNIHLKMFYRTIQFAIYHAIQLNSITKKRTLVKPQKLANLPQHITYNDLVELCTNVSNKMQITINPIGLMELVRIYLQEKEIENNIKSNKKLNNLDLMVWNKAVAKNQELTLDTRMYYDKQISLKTLYLSIQYFCEHILKQKIIEFTYLLDLNVDYVRLNSRSNCRDKCATTYQIDIMVVLFAYFINDLAKEENLVA